MRRLLLLVLAAAMATHAAPAASAAEVALPMRGDVLRVAVTGDTGDGTGEIAALIAKVHAATPLDAIILTGDNFYPCGVDSWNDPRWSIVRPIAAIGVPLFPVLGNHDYCGRNPFAQIGAPLWTFPAKEYAIRSRVADFVMIDTTPLAERDVRDAEQVIPALLASSTATWRIVVGHHVIASSGWHGFFRRAERKRMQRLLPLMRREHVDLYACGHDHHMELLDAKPRLLISGAGSHPITALTLRPHSLYPRTIRRELGFAVLEISARKLSIQFYDSDAHADGAPFVYSR